MLETRLDENTKTETSASRLQQAQRALAAAEWEERKERQQFNALETQEQQLCFELKLARTTENPPAALPAVQAAQRQVDSLSRKREQFARQKAYQGELVRTARQRLDAARRTYDDLQRRALQLQNIIRREERTVAQWQQQIKDTEQQLARWERMLAEGQARLEQGRWEYAELAGLHWKSS